MAAPPASLFRCPEQLLFQFGMESHWKESKGRSQQRIEPCSKADAQLIEAFVDATSLHFVVTPGPNWVVVTAGLIGLGKELDWLQDFFEKLKINSIETCCLHLQELAKIHKRPFDEKDLAVAKIYSCAIELFNAQRELQITNHHKKIFISIQIVEQQQKLAQLDREIANFQRSAKPHHNPQFAAKQQELIKLRAVTEQTLKQFNSDWAKI